MISYCFYATLENGVLLCDIDGENKTGPLSGEGLGELSRKACLQPRGLPLPRACEKATNAVVLRVGEGSSFGVRLAHEREWGA